MRTLQEARDFFGADAYAVQCSGAEILEVGEHYAKCRLVLDERHYSAAGHVMGAVPYTLADFAFAVATDSGRKIFTVTTSSQINYLSMPKGRFLTAEANLLKDGRRTCFYRMDIRDEDGTIIAIVNTVGTKLDPK